MDWPFILKRVVDRQPCVLVTLNLILGSAPRESGSRMVVTSGEVQGSIGGGNLEYSAIRLARELLADSGDARQVHKPWGLGPELNQCCGGAVTLHFEVLPQGSPAWLEDLQMAVREEVPALLASAIDRDPPLRKVLRDFQTPGVPASVANACQALLAQQTGSGTVHSWAPVPEPIVIVELAGDTWWLEVVRSNRVPLVLFGAGHVGREVARLLERLPFAVTWVDSREGEFPDDSASNIRRVCTGHPLPAVTQAKPGSVFVVMTHSHQLDEDICFEILKRGDHCWLGLIGSETKRKRFVHRLNRRGIPESLLTGLVCPIGLDGIHGKQPATIALSLVAQLMLEEPWMQERS